MAILKEQQVAIVFMGSSQQEAEFWWMNLQYAKPLGPGTQNVSYYSCASALSATAIFLWYWHSVNGHGEIHIAFNTVWLSLGNNLFNWAFLPVDFYEDDFLLTCTIYL